jgi:hypothetical protein
MKFPFFSGERKCVACMMESKVGEKAVVGSHPLYKACNHALNKYGSMLSVMD